MRKIGSWQITLVNLWPSLESLEATGAGAEALLWTWVSWPALFGDDGALSEDLGVNSLVEDLVDEAGVALAADAHDCALEGMWNHFTYLVYLLYENEKFRVYMYI